MAGTHSDWLLLSEWDFSGESAWLGDASFWSSEEDGLTIVLEPAQYRVEVRVADYGSECRIAGLRAIKAGTTPSLGTQLGESWADTATQGLCDAASFADAAEEDPENVAEAAMEVDAAAIIELPDGSPMFVVSCGFGDGEWPVFELVEGGQRVGLQVDFIAPGTEFPY